MRYYVAKFGFEAGGEAGVPFIHGVEARDAASAYKKVRHYMHGWYGKDKPDDETDRSWAWYDFGVLVKLSGIIEVKDFTGLWNETLPIR